MRTKLTDAPELVRKRKPAIVCVCALVYGRKRENTCENRGKKLTTSLKQVKENENLRLHACVTSCIRENGKKSVCLVQDERENQLI